MDQNLVSRIKNSAECIICHKQFKEKSKLNRHMLVHTGEKPHVCLICNKGFSVDYNLKTHMRVHTGEKPFQCEYVDCGKCFAQSDISDNQILTDELNELMSKLNKDSDDEMEESELFTSLSEKINTKKLLQLREKFTQADTDQGGALELEEFVVAFGNVICDGKLSNKELVKLFMRIDTNSDGSIDWDEFMNFIILENENLSHMRAEHCEYVNPKIPDPTASQKSNMHTDMINKLLIINPIDSTDPFRYFTASNDGTVKIWNGPNMSLFSTINVSKNWVTSLAYLKDSERVAAGTTDRQIAFYDLNKSSETISNAVSHLMDLKGIPLTMDYIQPKSVLAVGDDQGMLRLYKFRENWHICNPFLDCYEADRKDIKDKIEKKLTPELSEKVVKNHLVKNVEVWSKELHSAWITKAQFIPDIEGMLTSSLDKTIKQLDLERESVKSTFSHHKKGVLSFVYCRDLKLVASCGEERHISLWDPYSKTVAMTFLTGHNSAVIDLALNQDKNQLISLGTDKVVKVWDIRTFQCVQTITDTTTYRPENRLTGLYFNPKINSLVLTSKKINIWPFKATEEMPTSHESTVTCAIFNKNFSCIISGDEESTIHVWDVFSGELLFKFTDAHNGNRLTTMALDFSGRRLVTGAHDGSIKMWNFNNGQCLREFNYDHEPKEVSKLAFIGNDNSSKAQQIISVGWDKYLYIWPDENEPIVSWSKCLPARSSNEHTSHTGHTDDILSLTYCQKERLIVTGGQLGQIIAWHMETGFPKAYLHELEPSLLASYQGEPKAVEELLYSNLVAMLISVSADNFIRFWDMHEITFSFQNYFDNNNELVTCACLGPNDDVIVLGDEAGNVRIISFVPIPKFQILHHFNAHRLGISNVQLFTTEETVLTLLLTTGISRNVKIFNDQGNYLGYFGQNKKWNMQALGIKAREPKYSQVFHKGELKKKNTEEYKENKDKHDSFRASERKDNQRYDTVATDVFRGIKIDKYKIDPILEKIQQDYKHKTGRDYDGILAGLKKF